MTFAAPRILLVLTALAALSGCAGGARTVAGLADRCAVPPRGVVVTTKGTQLALRDAPAVAMLQRASTAETAGVAVLSCTPSSGVLGRCVVLYEEPGRVGLGKRALALADRVIWPADADQGTAEVRFRFDPEQGEQPARLCR